VELALFRSSDPEVVANVVAMMLGAAALGGASQVTGEAVDSIMKWFAPAANDRRGLPHRLLFRLAQRTFACTPQTDEGLEVHTW
jgi:hypothetical protein